MTEISGKLMDSLKAVIFPELAAIRETQITILARLDVIDKRFENVDQRFASLEKRQDDLRFDLNQRFGELRSDWDKRFAELRSDNDKRLADFRAEVDKRLADLRADINTRFAEGRADLNKRLDDFRVDINQRLDEIIYRVGNLKNSFRGIEDDLRNIRENKVVEIVQRHDELLAKLERDFSETSDRIRAIEQKSLRKLSKKVPEVKQSSG
jgi:DNA anti-recombination protein RmuC